MRTLKWITAASAALLIVACCPCRKNKSAAALPLTGIEWRLAQLYGESVPQAENYRMTLTDDGKISGVGDCNRFMGIFTMDGGQFRIGPNLATTRMFCPDQEREDKFMRALLDTDAYSIDGTRLMLIQNGEVTAIFDPVPDDK